MVVVVSILGISCESAPTSSSLPGQVADALCETNKRCCQLIGKVSDDELCRFSASSGVGLSRNVQEHPAFNADIAEACLKAARTWSCADSLQSLNGLCGLVYSGDVQAGGNCDGFMTCEQKPGANAICTSEHTCQPIVLLGRAGSSCDTTRPLTCAFFDGLWCMPNQAGKNAGICRPRLSIGEACIAHDQCRVNLYCDKVAGKCKPLLAEDEPCNDLDSCGPSLVCFRPTPEASTRCTFGVSPFACKS
jgi:hypothetical protein